ncbi:MAG: bifunctional 2-polyprenyl-6-hydroxyphenol methylase/3-demethylubiquinol 3-O-methyltransferase UbiG [Alphaproteobacteria bacterium]
MSYTPGASTINPAEVEQFSRIAEQWWDENGKFKPLHRINPLRISYIKARAAEHFAINEGQVLSGKTLLDIGCGGGLISEPMARLGAKVTGLDASEKNIAVATLHAQQSRLTIDYRSGSAEDLAATGANYDLVLALEVIEHVNHLDLFYDALTKLVAPGGMLILSTLNRTVKSYLMGIIGAEYILGWLPRGTHDWQKFIKPSEMQRALTQRGLEICDVTGMVFRPQSWEFALKSNDLDVNYLLVARRP